MRNKIHKGLAIQNIRLNVDQFRAFVGEDAIFVEDHCFRFSDFLHCTRIVEQNAALGTEGQAHHAAKRKRNNSGKRRGNSNNNQGAMNGRCEAETRENRKDNSIEQRAENDNPKNPGGGFRHSRAGFRVTGVLPFHHNGGSFSHIFALILE